jgi:hypothetical protein
MPSTIGIEHLLSADQAKARVGDRRGSQPRQKRATKCHLRGPLLIWRDIGRVNLIAWEHVTNYNGKPNEANQGRPMSIQRAVRELLALRQEIERLDARIGEARDRAVKLDHYIEMAREFDDGAAGEAASESGTHRAESMNGSRQRTPQGGMSGRAVQECISILRESGKPIHTKTLFEMIQQRGVRLGGANPAQALSGYLSRTPGLVANRSIGWSLEEWQKPEGETGRDDSSAPAGGEEREPLFQT